MPHFQGYDTQLMRLGEGGGGAFGFLIIPGVITRKEKEIKEGGYFFKYLHFCRPIFFFALQGYIQIH
jgi:hypothetical protein